MSGVPRHAGHRLPRASDGNNPPRGLQSGRAAQGSAQPVCTQHPTQAPRWLHPLAGAGRLQKGIRHRQTPCSLLTPHRSSFGSAPKTAGSGDRQPRVMGQGQGAQDGDQLPGPVLVLVTSRCPQTSLPPPREGRVLPVSHWLPRKPSGQ